MAGEITQTELQNARTDAETLADAVNTNATITPRTGSAFSSIPKLVADKGADLDAETANAASWAAKDDGAVNGSEYSAKAWASTTSLVPAGSARSWATRLSATVDGQAGNWSARAWATDPAADVDGGSAKSWANLTGAAVYGSEYSSKEYASGTLVPSGSAKEWANNEIGTVDGSEYSAKQYAQEDLTGSAGGSAKDWAVTTEDTEVTTGLYSALHYAAKAAESATAAENALDEFNFRYLGPHADDAAAESYAAAELGVGDFYFNTSDNVQRYYTGSGWVTTGAPTATVGISDGGTGATTATGARTALGVGTLGEQDADNVNIDGGAIDGTTIGGTTPAAIAATTLSVTTSAGGTSLTLTDAANSTLFIKHESPANLLTYETGGTAIQRWVLNGAEHMRLVPTSGNLGIGTTNPTEKLDVNGKVKTSGTIYSAAVITDGREVNVDYYGATPDLEYYDGAATIDIGVSTTVVTIGGGVTVPTWVTAGTIVIIRNAGAASAAPGSSDKTSHYTTVASRDSSTQITLNSGAGASVTAERIAFMTDNTTAVNAAIAVLPAHGGRLTFKGQGYHIPGISLASKKALEILGRGRTVLMGNAEAQTLFHVQSTCDRAGMEGITLGGLAATRDRVNGRVSGVNLRWDASNSELRSVSSFGAADFGIFVGQDASNITRDVHLLGGRSYENTGDGWHVGHVEDIWMESLHASDNGDDDFGFVGYEAAAAVLKGVRMSDCSSQRSDHRGLLIKHCEDVVIKDFDARECNGASCEIHVFPDGSGQTGANSHFNDNITIKGFRGVNCGKDATAAGFGVYHSNRVELEDVNIVNSGTTTTAEKSNITVFNNLNVQFRGGSNIMDRSGAGFGFYYHRDDTGNSTFEGRQHRYHGETDSIESYSINGMYFKMGQTTNGNDIYIVPRSEHDNIAALTINNCQSESYRGARAQNHIVIDQSQVDFLDVGQDTVRNSADDGSYTVNSNRNVFSHTISLI